jgi:hypothetical protein
LLISLKNVPSALSYAREIVAGMLLYNSITMQYKSLYIDAVKSEIFKYEGLYHQDAPNPTAFNALTSFVSVSFSTDFRYQEASNDFHDELK